MDFLQEGVYGIWGFPNIRGTFLAVPIILVIVFGGLYWGPLILGKYHISQNEAPCHVLFPYSKNAKP